MASRKLRELVGPETVLSIPGIKAGIAQNIEDRCGCTSIAGVCSMFKECKTDGEVGDLVRACCRNPRGGETITRPDGTPYKIPTVNERAACGLLDTLIERGTFEGTLGARVRRMRLKMRGGAGATAPPGATPGTGSAPQ
jgi:hypothetical protein